MIIMTSLLRRIDGMTCEEFRRYHREQHAPLFSSTPEARKFVRRYTIEHPEPTRTPGLPGTSFDAVVRMWFDSRADFMRMFSSRAYWTKIRPDEKRFFDFSKSEFYFTHEQVLLGEPQA
jgi:uncharacterized protein (TIGR02118 family)